MESDDDLEPTQSQTTQSQSQTSGFTWFNVQNEAEAWGRLIIANAEPRSLGIRKRTIYLLDNPSGDIGPYLIFEFVIILNVVISRFYQSICIFLKRKSNELLDLDGNQ